MRSVFLSSHLDEVSLERRAAYEAIARTGMIPILFDAALIQLTDDKIWGSSAAVEGTLLGPSMPKPASEKRLSNRRELREQLDVLIDSSDYFIGIYESRMGAPEYSLHWLHWVEYELIRFLVGQKFQRNGARRDRQLTKRVSDELRCGESPDHMLEILANDDVAEILSERCLLFWKREADGPRPGFDLDWFLSILRGRLTEFRTTRTRTDANEFLYQPAYIDLYRRSLQWCRQLAP